MKLIRNSLQNQILLICFVIVLVTTVSILAGFWWFSSRYSETQMQAGIDDAQRVLEQYLDAQADLLTTAARVLTADFGFRQAVATRDAETIASALDNHGQRINADIMLLLDLEGDLLASSGTGPLAEEDLGGVLSLLASRPGTAAFVMLDGRLYQTMVLPVEAPRTIAYTLLGFEIDAMVTAELQTLTSMDISFVVDHEVRESTLSLPPGTEPKDYLDSQQLGGLFGARQAYSNREIPLFSKSSSPVTVLLSASLAEQYREFDRLVYAVLIIALVIVLLLILFSHLLARGLAGPLSMLAERSRRLARGDFQSVRNLPRQPHASHEVSELMDAFADMGQQIETREQQVRYQAQHDQLTGLYNRYTMLEHIQSRADAAQHFVLLGAYFHGLGPINDSMGPETGDRCLQLIAARLEQFVTTRQGLNARLDGVEFLALMPVADSTSAGDLAEQARSMLEVPLELNNLSLPLSVTIGFLSVPVHGQDAVTLLRRVRLALDAGRREGLSVRGYQEGEDEAHLARISLLEELREAMLADDGQLFMHYQPKVGLVDDRVVSVEALIRWQHPEQGFVSPEVFVTLAENTGLVTQLTRWVVETVLLQLARWQQQRLSLHAAINISAQDLVEPGFVDMLQTALERHDIPAERITLEITERDIMRHEEQSVAVLELLSRLGFSIAVDDYGVGQSSLAKLKTLPVDILKIDKAFVMHLDEVANDQHIVNSTIALGHELGLKVIAEGVENRASYDMLKAMGCDQAQGYFISRPLKSEALSEWQDDYHATL